MARSKPDLQALFDQLKAAMERYAPPLSVSQSVGGRYELATPNPVEITGNKRPNLFFAAAIIQSSYVGFYYMPVYTDEEVRDFFTPRLLSLRKGKSCFHIKALDDELLDQIDSAMERGIQLYREKGWLMA